MFCYSLHVCAPYAWERDKLYWALEAVGCVQDINLSAQTMKYLIVTNQSKQVI